MKNYKIIAGLLLFAGVSMSNAQSCNSNSGHKHQTDVKSSNKTIVMTQSELDSFVNRVKELRRQKLQQMSANRPNSLPVRMYNSTNDYRNTEQLLRDLDNKLNILLYSNNRDNGNAALPLNTQHNDSEYLRLLEAKIALLESRLAGQQKPEVITKTDTKTVTVTKNSKYDELISKYGNYEKKFYFGNDSSKVSSSDYSLINEVAQIVKAENPHIKVQLKGYASKVGSPLYNVKLSERRTKAVKDILLRQGIPASSIEILPLGEDNNAYSDAQARRVELNLFIIR